MNRLAQALGETATLHLTATPELLVVTLKVRGNVWL
jgi:hypothetical protein